MRDGVILIAQHHVTRVYWTSLYTDTSSSLVGFVLGPVVSTTGDQWGTCVSCASQDGQMGPVVDS